MKIYHRYAVIGALAFFLCLFLLWPPAWGADGTLIPRYVLKTRGDTAFVITVDWADTLRFLHDGTSWAIIGSGGILTTDSLHIDDGGYFYFDPAAVVDSALTDSLVNSLGRFSGSSSNAAISDSSIILLNATAWRMFFSNATATAIQELAFGTSGKVLTSGGASANPTWETPASGGEWNSVGGDSSLQWYAAADTGIEFKVSNDTSFMTPGSNTVLVIGDAGLTTMDSARFNKKVYYYNGDSLYFVSMNDTIDDGERCYYYVSVAAAPDSAYYGACTGGAGESNTMSSLGSTSGRMEFNTTKAGVDLPIRSLFPAYGLNGDSTTTAGEITLAVDTGTQNGVTGVATKGFSRDSAGAGSGDVTKVGTPVDNQIGVWTGDGTIEGDVDLTYDGINLAVTDTVRAGAVVSTGDIYINKDSSTADANLWFSDNDQNETLKWDYLEQRFELSDNTYINGTFTATGNIDVTSGNITLSGTVDGVDIAALNTNLAADSGSWNATADALGTTIDSTKVADSSLSRDDINWQGGLDDSRVQNNITVDKASDVDTTGTDISTALGNRLSGNETITLSGDVGGSGATAITTTIQANAVESTMVGIDQINDLDINFGTGTDQVSTDDVTEGTNKYDQALPDSANWSKAFDSVGVWDNGAYPKLWDTTATADSLSYTGTDTLLLVRKKTATTTEIDVKGEDTLLLGTRSAGVRIGPPGLTQIDSLKSDSIYSEHIISNTELMIPNSANPTTDTEGQIAWDSDDDGIEVYDGATSMLIPALRKIEVMIWNPDLITDTIPIFYVDSTIYQGGITLVACELQTSVDGSYVLELYDFTAADPPVSGGSINTLTVGASDQRVQDETFTDAVLAVGEFIYIDTPATDIDWIRLSIRYYVMENN